MEQKANLNTLSFMLCSNVFENFPAENQMLWDEKLILKCVLNLVKIVPISLKPTISGFSFFVDWQRSVGICLAFKVGSTIYDWQCPPLLRHQHKPFLHMTYRTYTPLSGPSLIFSSNFLSGKAWWMLCRWQMSLKLPTKNGFWISSFQARNRAFSCRMLNAFTVTL